MFGVLSNSIDSLILSNGLVGGNCAHSLKIEIKISCLVEKEDAERSVKALHEVFELGSDIEADVNGDLPNL